MSQMLLLNEFCVKLGVPMPKYELEQMQTLPSVFQATCTLTVNNYIYLSTGRGQKKKDAQQNAAKAMFYEQLKVEEGPMAYKRFEAKKHEESICQKPATAAENQRDLVTQEMPPGAQSNTIGELKEICDRRGMPQPIYTDEAAEGPSHCPMFTVKCTVGNLEKTGKSRTKQQAKKLAAHFVVNVLKTLDNATMSSLMKGLPDMNESTNEDVERMQKVLSKSSASTSVISLEKTYADFEASVRMPRKNMFANILPKHRGENIQQLLSFRKDLAKQHPYAAKPVHLVGEWLRKRKGGVKGFFQQLLNELNFTFDFQSTKNGGSFIVILEVLLPLEEYEGQDPVVSIKIGDQEDDCKEACMIDIVTIIASKAIWTNYNQ